MILSCIAKFINAGRRSTYMEACMCTFHLRCVCISNKPAQLVSKAVQMEETADQQEAWFMLEQTVAIPLLLLEAVVCVIL